MRHTPATIQQLLTEQSSSGLSVADFCAERELKIPTFYSWRKKYATEQTTSPPTGFCQITPSTAPVRRSLSLPSGLRLELTGLTTGQMAELIIQIDRAYA